MKKIISIILITIASISASAQMMTSRTLMKKKIPTTWYVRTGPMINFLNGVSEEDKEYFDLTTGSKVGFDFDFGFNRPIGKAGAYWGMDLGIANRGGKVEGRNDILGSFNAWAIKYSPIVLGYKYPVTNDIKIDGHISGYASVDMSQTVKSENSAPTSYDDSCFDSSFDAGIQIGVGAWYKKINIDFSYQYGFNPSINVFFGRKGYWTDSSLRTSALLIRLGYAF